MNTARRAPPPAPHRHEKRQDTPSPRSPPTDGGPPVSVPSGFLRNTPVLHKSEKVRTLSNDPLTAVAAGVRVRYPYAMSNSSHPPSPRWANRP